jgi:hypothetical protein
VTHMTASEAMVDPEELAEPFRRDALAFPKRFLDRDEHLDVDNSSSGTVL